MRVKPHEPLLLPTMSAQVLPPSLLHQRNLSCKYEGLLLGNVIVLHVPVLVDGVHLSDSAVLNHNVLVAPWRHDERRSRTMYTRRKPCPMQPDKERLYVLCNSKTTTEAIYCINIDVHWHVVVFQSLGRLRDVFAQK
jgi:hypothetical protein